MKRQRRIEGDIVRIPLGDGTRAYARVLPHSSFAFYDHLAGEADPPAEQILKRPVLFIVAVMNHAVTRGRWERVGNAPVEEPLSRLPPKFIQDAFPPYRCRLYLPDGTMRDATREECLGLERSAVWEPEHVEDRLRDHYAGRPNVWLESMKLR